MTGKARVFKEILEDVYERYGFGSTKTVTKYPKNIEFTRDLYSIYDLNWLIQHRYLFHFQVTRYDSRRNWRYQYRTDDIYGVTKKGWGVSHLYSKKVKKHPVF